MAGTSRDPMTSLLLTPSAHVRETLERQLGIYSLKDEAVLHVESFLGSGYLESDIRGYRGLFSKIERSSVKNADEQFVLIKAVEENPPSKSYTELKKQMETSLRMPDHANILKPMSSLSHYGIFYMYYPDMVMGSLRSLMLEKKFKTGGLPCSLVVVCLREVLRGLVLLHGSVEYHGFINAGQIYLSDKPELKLTFSGTINDFGTVQDDPKYALPKQRGGRSSHEDIWQLGFTALELSYGLASAHAREEARSNYVRTGNFPPTTGQERLPEKFRKMVLWCLNPNAADRPSAEILLETGVIKKEKKKVEDLIKYITEY